MLSDLLSKEDAVNIFGILSDISKYTFDNEQENQIMKQICDTWQKIWKHSNQTFNILMESPVSLSEFINSEHYNILFSHIMDAIQCFSRSYNFQNKTAQIYFVNYILLNKIVCFVSSIISWEV